MILTEGEKSLTSLYEKQENNALESNQLKNKKEMLVLRYIPCLSALSAASSLIR